MPNLPQIGGTAGSMPQLSSSGASGGLIDYGQIRENAIAMVKGFARKIPINIVRPVNTVDTTKPWRAQSVAQLRFPTLAVVTPLAFPKRSDPVMDMDVDVYLPGDVTDVAALSDPSKRCGDIQLTDLVDTQGVVYSILGVHDVRPDDKSIVIHLRCKPWPQIVTQPPTEF